MVTKVKTYSFGLLSPITNADKVSDEMKSAHRYQNAFIEIEKWRREEIRKLQSKFGNASDLEQALTNAEEAFNAIDKKIKAANAKARTHVDTKEQRDERQAAKLLKKEAALALKTFRKALNISKKRLDELKEDDSTASEYERAFLSIKKEVSERRAVIRGGENAPWYGTYMLVEEAVQATCKMPLYDGTEPNDPKYRRWDGCGRFGIKQFQPNEPMTKVIGDGASSLYIQILPYKNGATRKGGKKPLKLLRVRIGSDGRKPIWAEFPMIYHRAIPNDAEITTVQVMREIVGTDQKWQVSITVKENVEEYVVKPFSAIAFDLGWRSFEDRIRVAYYHTTNNESGEIAVPIKILDQLRKVETLQSTIDTEFDLIRGQFKTWLDTNAEILPDWLKEKVQFIDKWKSPARLVKVINEWQTQRFAGDEVILGKKGVWNHANKTLTRGEGLLGWKYHQTHLYNWVRNQSEKARLHLIEHYKVAAAKFANQYDVVVFENINLANLAKSKVGSTNRQLTAPSKFRNACKNVFERKGGKEGYVEVPAANTSKIHNKCGYKNDLTPALMHVCAGCKEELDRDENAARNILDRYLSGEYQGAA